LVFAHGIHDVITPRMQHYDDSHKKTLVKFLRYA
jgi:hypothetical protein